MRTSGLFARPAETGAHPPPAAAPLGYVPLTRGVPKCDSDVPRAKARFPTRSAL